MRAYKPIRLSNREQLPPLPSSREFSQIVRLAREVRWKPYNIDKMNHHFLGILTGDNFAVSATLSLIDKTRDLSVTVRFTELRELSPSDLTTLFKVQSCASGKIIYTFDKGGTVTVTDSNYCYAKPITSAVIDRTTRGVLEILENELFFNVIKRAIT